MARTIQEIKDSMTSDFMAQEAIRNAYGLSEGDTFEESFSVVSLESILFSIVATCAWVIESLFDRHKAEVYAMADSAIVASVRWYYEQALKFQKGDALVYNSGTKGFGYDVEDPKKRIVKYCAVRDEGNRILLLVSQDNNGKPEKLSDDDLSLFNEYMNRIKIAGVVLATKSFDADVVRVRATVKIDPLVITRNGQELGGDTYPVVEAIDNYLYAITYGGAISKSNLIIAMQAIPGVIDVTRIEVSCSVDGLNFKPYEGNEYKARSGCFVSDNLKNSITYVF